MVALTAISIVISRHEPAMAAAYQFTITFSSENNLFHQAVAAGFSLRPKLSSHVKARKLKFAATTGLTYFHAPL